MTLHLLLRSRQVIHHGGSLAKVGALAKGAWGMVPTPICAKHNKVSLRTPSGANGYQFSSDPSSSSLSASESLLIFGP